MSKVDNSLAGLTLDDVLGKAKQAKQQPVQNKPKQAETPPVQNKTKQVEPPPAKNKTKQAETPPAKNKAKQAESLPVKSKAKQAESKPDTVPDDTSTKEKKSWKLFREKFLLKKAAGSAWTSSIHIPASDVNVQGNRSQGGERAAPAGKPLPQLARRTSVRYDNHDSADSSTQSDGPPSKSFKPHNASHYSTSKGDDDDDDDEDDGASLRGVHLRGERSLSAREAVASQEAAEAAAKQEEAENNGLPEGDEPVKMSLMDLLGETGSSYIDEDDEDYDEDDEEEEEEEEEELVQSKGAEFTCCVCKVNITSSAYMPCTHTFCRLCSKEFSVQRGNCPLCNGFVSEILEIF